MRGLRLPYGKRTGVTAVDRLNIIAHDKFQEIIDEANKPGSAIRLATVELGDAQLAQKTETVVSEPNLVRTLGLHPTHATHATVDAARDAAPLFTTPEAQQVAQLAYGVIRQLENQPQRVPTVAHLQQPEIQAEIVKAVEAQRPITQLSLTGVPVQSEGQPQGQPDIAAIVAQTVALVVQQTIAIPRILVVPRGEVTSGFTPFTLDLKALNYAPASDELWVQNLRTGQRDIVAPVGGGVEEQRLEDYVVSGLIDFDDISYDDHADLLYDLASQTVAHFRNYLAEDEARGVLRHYQRNIAAFVHSQMQEHHWEKVSGYDVIVRKGFTELKPSAYTYAVQEPDRACGQLADKSNMAKYLFGGFARCLYPVQKFASDAERKLAVILERDAIKWCKPALGQFPIVYREGADHPEYQPDFVAETAEVIYMLEPKASNQMNDSIVLAKRDAAVTWCAHATAHALGHGGKPWRYALIPHDVIAENMTLDGLAKQYGVMD